MKKKTKVKKKIFNPISLCGIGILVIVTFLTIGFSSFNNT